MKSISVARVFLAGICCFSPATAFAGLIQSSPFELSMHGTGFGNVDTLITLQTQNGNVTSEAGCIGYAGATDECGINQVGKIKNSSSTQPLPLGLTNAGDLRFVFNASEAAGSSIDLNQLEVSFYGASTTPLFSAWLAAPMTLTSTVPGIGNSGFAFQLDSTATAQANAVLGSVTRIGAGFAATNASGGQDTLYLARAAAPNASATPEPASCALLGAGMVAIGLLARRKRNARKG
jgi:PEP-CTERM motif-containing protein